MIQLSRRRLALVFATVIILSTGLVFAANYFVANRALTSGVTSYISDEIEKDFMYFYKADDLEAVKQLKTSEHFQVIDDKGNIRASSFFSDQFTPRVNRRLLADAFRGLSRHETIKFEGRYYFVTYFPLDGTYSGRVATSLELIRDFKKKFLELLVFAVPVLLLISFVASRYLVGTAMKPISDAFIFQEHFSSNVSHELRSPLTALKGNLEVTLRKGRTADEYIDSLEAGLKDVDRIIKLVDNLKLLASSELKPLDLLNERVDVGRLFADVLNVFMADINAGSIKLETSIKAGEYLLCDAALMRRALENLMSNAVKYTPEGGTIKLSVLSGPKAVKVVLSNTCRDLDRADIVPIFEPFKRGRNAVSGNIAGAGLGLYIARYIVRSHGGDISSDVDGEVFSVTLELPLKK